MGEQLTRDELLVLLIEECGEIIQAVTKCQRFGFDSNHVLEYGINSERLSQEIGDLLGVVDELLPHLDLFWINEKRSGKIAKAIRAKAKYLPNGPAERTRP